MNTQEQLKTIIEVLIEFGLDKEQSHVTGLAIQAYGDNRFNEAVDACLHNAYCDSDAAMEYNLRFLPQLKIPTS